MIFLPKSFERYIASLRFYIHLSIARKGFRRKHFEMLRKINIAEALYSADETAPLDVIKLSNSLLGAAVIIMLQRGRNLAVSFSGHGSYLMNEKLYSTLILNIIEKCIGRNSEIVISAENCGIIIKIYSCHEMKSLKKIIKALNGVYFSDSSTNTAIISIPALRTLKASVEIDNEWCYLLDKFSPVNIFLKNYPIDNNL